MGGRFEGIVTSVVLPRPDEGRRLYWYLGPTGEGSSGKNIFGMAPLTPFQCAYGIFGVGAVCHATIVFTSSPMTMIVAFTIFEVNVFPFFYLPISVISFLLTNSFRMTVTPTSDLRRMLFPGDGNPQEQSCS